MPEIPNENMVGFEREPQPTEPQGFVAFESVIEAHEDDCLAINSGWQKIDWLANETEAAFVSLVTSAAPEIKIQGQQNSDLELAVRSMMSRNEFRSLPTSRNLQRMVKASIMRARLISMYHHYASEENKVGLPEVDASYVIKKMDIAKNALREKGYTDEIDNNNIIVATTRVGAELEVLAFPIFMEIEGTNKKMIHLAGDYISQGKDQFISFNGWLLEQYETDNGTYRAYLTTLANDVLDENSEQYLKKSYEQLFKDAPFLLAEDFLYASLANEKRPIHDDLKAMVEIVKAVLDETAYSKDAVEVFCARPSLWPPFVQKEYVAFAQKWKREQIKALTGTLENYKSSNSGYRQLPTHQRIEQVEDAYQTINDADLVRLMGKPQAPVSKKRGHDTYESKRRTSGRVTAPKDANEENETKPKVLCRLKEIAEGYLIEKDERNEVDEMIREYAREYPGEAGLEDSLRGMIEQILDDPKGPGSVKMYQPMSFGMKGQLVLRRFTPRKNPTVTTGSHTANRTRVMYAVNDNGLEVQVAIKEIIHKNDMESKYGN